MQDASQQRGENRMRNIIITDTAKSECAVEKGSFA